MSGPREWDAAAYAALVLPHVGWGRGVLERLAPSLHGDERVLDAGCGTGRDAAALRQQWPGVHVVALDGSQRMLEQARDRLGDNPAHATYVQADLSRPLPLDLLGGPVDAVMSVATFHWLPDHAALLGHLAAVMRPGAPLVADCGGAGNVGSLDAAIAAVTGTPGEDWEFAGAEETRGRLEAAGFEVRDVRLRFSPFRIEDPAVLDSYLATVCLGAHLAALPADEHAGFVRAVRIALPEPVVDYVRLELEAVRR